MSSGRVSKNDRKRYWTRKEKVQFRHRQDVCVWSSLWQQPMEIWNAIPICFQKPSDSSRSERVRLMRSKKNSWCEIPVPYINYRRKRNSGLKNLIHEPTWRFFNDPHLFSSSGSNFSSLSEKKNTTMATTDLRLTFYTAKSFIFWFGEGISKKFFPWTRKKKCGTSCMARQEDV